MIKQESKLAMDATYNIKLIFKYSIITLKYAFDIATVHAIKAFNNTNSLNALTE